MLPQPAGAVLKGEAHLLVTPKRGALLFVHLSPVADLHHQHHVGGLDAVDHAVVADAEAAGASETVAQRFAELEGVCGELLIRVRPGIAQSTISAIETNRIKLGAERGKMLARALNVHPAVLVFPGWRTEEESAV